MGTGPSKFLASSSLDYLGNQIESADYVRAELENKQRAVPTVDFSRPENFAKHGSAEEYYKTSIERIYKDLSHSDGSKKEKIQWSLSSSYLDNYIFLKVNTQEQMGMLCLKEQAAEQKQTILEKYSHQSIMELLILHNISM